MSAPSSATIFSGLEALSGAVGAIGGLTTSSANASAAEYNAQLDMQNAELAKRQGVMQLQQQQMDATRKLGAIKAGYGASGVTMSGSPLDVLADSYTQAQLDADTIAFNSKVRQTGYQNSAALNMSKAANERNAGYVGAAAKALDTGKEIYDVFDTVGTTPKTGPQV